MPFQSHEKFPGPSLKKPQQLNAHDELPKGREIKGKTHKKEVEASRGGCSASEKQTIDPWWIMNQN